VREGRGGGGDFFSCCPALAVCVLKVTVTIGTLGSNCLRVRGRHGGEEQGLRWINPSAIYPLIIVTSIVIVGNVRALLF